MSGHIPPRTDAEPMAFTGAEFARGAASAGLRSGIFVFAFYTIVFFPIGYYSIHWIFPAVIAATVVGSVPAWILGRSLRRVESWGIHTAAFASLGALVAGATSMIVFLMINPTATNLSIPWPVFVNALCGALGVALAWRAAARRGTGRRGALAALFSRSPEEGVGGPAAPQQSD